MARAIWTGAISFGLVDIPVKLFSATEQKDVRFKQFQEGTGQSIRYRRVAEASGEEVPYEDIVKGYEIDDGRFVIVTPGVVPDLGFGREAPPSHPWLRTGGTFSECPPLTASNRTVRAKETDSGVSKMTVQSIRRRGGACSPEPRGGGRQVAARHERGA